MATLHKGDQVQKIKGYPWPGEVVSLFKTRNGEARVVVECTVKGVEGALHIYNPQQLRLVGRPAVKRRVTHTRRRNGNSSRGEGQSEESDAEG